MKRFTAVTSGLYNDEQLDTSNHIRNAMVGSAPYRPAHLRPSVAQVKNPSSPHLHGRDDNDAYAPRASGSSMEC